MIGAGSESEWPRWRPRQAVRTIRKRPEIAWRGSAARRLWLIFSAARSTAGCPRPAPAAHWHPVRKGRTEALDSPRRVVHEMSAAVAECSWYSVCNMIRRTEHVHTILQRLRTFPVVAILGPRQIGKTTLALQVARRYSGPAHRLDLDQPADLNRLFEDPGLVLADLRGLVVIDEVQRRPDLFPLLRVLADRRPRPARFLVLGSASPDLIRQSSESLAGRVNYYRLGGLGLHEVGDRRLDRRWLRGGFPRAWLARSNGEAFLWIDSFVQTFLERDLPALGIRVPGPALRRFWTMLAHWARAGLEFVRVRAFVRGRRHHGSPLSGPADRRSGGPPIAAVGTRTSPSAR